MMTLIFIYLHKNIRDGAKQDHAWNNVICPWKKPEKPCDRKMFLEATVCESIFHDTQAAPARPFKC